MILTLFMALIVQISFAQQKTVSGTVSDENGLPLIGTTVLVVGTSSGTTTDFDGNYAIKAKTGDVLSYSYVGYATQNKTVGAASTINLALQLDNSLDEVVVTALGIKREEKALGYSIQSIKGEGMTEARESNISNALSGKIAGVQVTGTSGSVGSSSRIVLRGNSSITGNNEPLYVVDGVPIDNQSFGNAGSGGGVDLPNGAADINPDDIESITVLKGPNAAALYGLRAGNGVIVITTKKGTPGKKFSVSFNSNITFSNPLLLPSYQNSYGQGGDPSYFEWVDGASGGTGDGVDESWGAPLDVGLEYIQWNSQLNGGKPLPWVSHPDNVKDFLDTGINTTNSISFTTGKTRVSIGNSEEYGMVPNTELKKFNVGVNTSIDLGERMTADASVTFFNTDSDNLPISGYNNENPFQQFIWSARNVDFQELRDWRSFPLAPDGTPLSWNHNFQNNPYWVLETNTNDLSKDRLIGNVKLNYNLTDWATLSGTIGADSYSQFETRRQAVGSNNAVNGSYTEIQRRYEEINSSILLSINKNLTEDIGFGINFGGNSMSREYRSTYANLPALELPNLYTLTNLQSGSIAGLREPLQTSPSRDEKINSFYFYGQLSYKNFLFVDFTGRNDWASVLPTNNNSFFYPSVSTSLVLSDAFDIKGDVISFLKIRGGWSKVGSTGALSPYRIRRTFGLANTGFGNSGFLPNEQPNPNLKAETVTGIEFGVDAKLFNNKIRLAATYYDQDSKDLLLPVDVTAGTGSGSIWGNIGNMNNKGFELQLGATVIETDDLRFDVDLNWAKNDNQVISLRGFESYTLGGQWGLTLQARPGQPYGVLVGRDFERSPSGQVVYEDGLPVINTEDQQILGDIAPDWTGGANFNLKYKNIEILALVDAKIGGDIHSMTYNWGRYAGTLEETLIGRETGVVGNGVMSDGNGGYVTNNVVTDAKSFNQAAYSNSIHSSAVFDASYVKLRQVSLGYNFSTKLLEKVPFESLKISIVGRNLALLYKKVPHIDPETGFSSANSEQGQEFGQYPSARNIGLNVNLKF